MIAAADILRYVLSTGGLIILVLSATLWLAARPASVRARRLLVVLAVFFALAATYGVDYAAGRALLIGLRPFTRADAPAGGRTAIVVLGSGSTTVFDWNGEQFSTVDRHAASRVLEAARVYRLIQPAIVISSGGLPHPARLEVPSGETMRDALVSLGVPASRIVVETRSRTTHDEAAIVAPMLASLGVDHVVLVTSDTHMRRSLGTFRAQGIVATPAIARSVYPVEFRIEWMLPTRHGLDAAAEVAHEYLGIAYYTLRGWYRW
ncbi:MAG: YdcF family protein [Betaproteobacteria bacterium]